MRHYQQHFISNHLHLRPSRARDQLTIRLLKFGYSLTEAYLVHFNHLSMYVTWAQVLLLLYSDLVYETMGSPVMLLFTLCLEGIPLILKLLRGPHLQFPQSHNISRVPYSGWYLILN